ncbi:di-heme oxidoredictase family protein [Terasakiella pusilla]|uniref:di-heme oxidoredictase family protein n=1 Tax=Terasakiella pusilla TaxID=64973 RepID=UPI003AA8ABBC
MKRVLPLLGLVFFTPSSHAGDLDFAMGKALFDRPWTSAPSSTQATDGLGPLFNARSCLACHPKNGRGEITLNDKGEIGGLGYVIRIGNEKGGPDPVYGRQLQTNAVHGLSGEAHVLYKDGYYDIRDLAYGPMAKDTNYAGRLSQPLHGLGLLEKVSDDTILANADPDDTDNNGISGRPNIIDGKIGRFAWKATAPSLYIQAGNAFSNDIGMSTPVNPNHYGDCTEAQKDCLAQPHGGTEMFEGLEIDSKMLGYITTYLQRLKAPAPTALSDDGLFAKTGCADCHIPSLPTKDGQSVTAYSDLLLHDMGNGLTDGIREGDASGREWRTQPLWGTRDTKLFLHDGRAKSVEEAINWHGGEAQNAKERFNSLSETDKFNLLRFVNSL